MNERESKISHWESVINERESKIYHWESVINERENNIKIERRQDRENNK